MAENHYILIMYPNSDSYLTIELNNYQNLGRETLADIIQNDDDFKEYCLIVRIGGDEL